MSPALNGSSGLQCFKHNAVEICNEITFDFYTGLPHIRYLYYTATKIDVLFFCFFSYKGNWLGQTSILVPGVIMDCKLHVAVPCRN